MCLIKFMRKLEKIRFCGKIGKVPILQKKKTRQGDNNLMRKYANFFGSSVRYIY